MGTSIRKLLILLLPLLLYTGCIREGMDDCEGGLRITFEYSHNMQWQDLLAEQVKDIRVYLYDRNTRLLEYIFQATSADIAKGYIDVEVADGPYTIIAWGGGGDDLTDHYSLPEVIGETNLEDYRMMLYYDPMPGGEPNEVMPRTEDFDHLFYASAENVEVRTGPRQTVDLKFIKNTNVLHTRITGLEYLSDYTSGGRAPGPGQPLRVCVMGQNGIYLYDDRLDPQGPIVCYEPPYHTLTANTMELDIKVQRFHKEHHGVDNPVMFYVSDFATGLDIVPPLDVVDMILKTQDEQGNPLYLTQSDIDRQDEYYIVISILRDLSVSVTVNGYEVVEPGVIIGGR